MIYSDYIWLGHMNLAVFSSHIIFVNLTVMLCGLYVIKLAATLSTNPLDLVLNTHY